MNICSTHLRLKIVITHVTLTKFWILQLATFHQKMQNLKILDDFERDETEAYLWRAGLLNVKEKGMAICYIRNMCLVMFLRGGKVNVAQY